MDEKLIERVKLNAKATQILRRIVNADLITPSDVQKEAEEVCREIDNLEDDGISYDGCRGC